MASEGVELNKNVQRAILQAHKLHAEHVFNMAYQEGNPFTFVEVKTLLDGVTVGGRRLSDERQVLRISNAWQRLFELVETGSFKLSELIAHELHTIVAEREAREWGSFRTGNVLIAGTSYQPPRPDDLPNLFGKMLVRTRDIEDPEQRAFTVFLDCARNQYYFDANKRTGQLLMNGVLLTAGEHIASIPASRTEEYNARMLDFYDSGNEAKMRELLAECRDAVRNMVRLRNKCDRDQ